MIISLFHPYGIFMTVLFFAWELDHIKK